MGAADGPARTALEFAIAERNAVALGASIETLMGEAGRAVAAEAIAHAPQPSDRIAVIAGAGNNGGDGSSAVHELLARGRTTELWMVAGASATRSIAARRWFERVAGGTPVHEGPPTPGELRHSALVVDAMLGTGQTGALRDPYRAAARAIRDSGVPVLAVDVPSGLGDPDAIQPRWTVTFTAPKVGLDEANAGSITVRDIGIPPAAFSHTGPGEFLAYPAPTPRGRDARVAVVGGGPYSGAPALAALAALRAGAERATMLGPSPAADAVRAHSLDLIVSPVGTDHLRLDDVATVHARLAETRYGAVVIGMGLGRSPETVDAVRALLSVLAGTVPLVIDADALDGLSGKVRSGPKAPIVVTPNEGEFARAFGTPPERELVARTAQVEAVARERGVTVVLKGREDVVASEGRVVVCGPHSPSANVGGSGDVLAGVIGRLLASGLSGFEAGRLATYWLDDASRGAASRQGDGLLATDLLARLPHALVDGQLAARLS
jgi:ADP-dependent NAD(P)H-hydrate dehydratase / NAD(P)H-hydrate epimerase